MKKPISFLIAVSLILSSLPVFANTPFDPGVFYRAPSSNFYSPAPKVKTKSYAGTCKEFFSPKDPESFFGQFEAIRILRGQTIETINKVTMQELSSEPEFHEPVLIKSDSKFFHYRAFVKDKHSSKGCGHSLRGPRDSLPHVAVINFQRNDGSVLQYIKRVHCKYCDARKSKMFSFLQMGSTPKFSEQPFKRVVQTSKTDFAILGFSLIAAELVACGLSVFLIFKYCRKPSPTLKNA